MSVINEHAGRQGKTTRGIRHLGHEVHVGELPQNFTWDQIPSDGRMVHHNVIHLTGGLLNPGSRQFIVNFRDPRDVMCNQFYWQDYHRNFGESEGDFKARLAVIHEKGLDRWIMDRIPRNSTHPEYYYNKFLSAVDRIPSTQRVINTYARVCLDFDGFIRRVVEVFGILPTKELMADLAVERPEGLVSNAHWVGQRWVGGDTAPGRYRRELKEETIRALTDSHAHILRRMARLDEEFAALYLEDVRGA